ncbi:MAG TPA: choice-of-anchor Q domain-containing protein, partial [Polyangia bacterium]
MNDGGGAGIFVRDGILHVIDVTFANNAAASPGPDVGGGAIYANGSLGVVIVDSKFTGNSGSNAGAVGMLNSDLTLVGNTFDGNMATGTGANSVDTSKCSAMGGEIGDGGNGGAVAIDGGSDGTVTTCGNVFHANVAGALGGAMFRTPDNAVQESSIDQSLFDSNTSNAGGALYFHHSHLVITASTFTANSAPGAGAIQADDTMLDFTNVTFATNHATKGLGGAMSIFGNGGTLTNVTFAGNDSNGGSGYFAAAIAGGTAFTIDNTLFMNDTTMDAGAPMQCQGASTGSGNLQWPMTHVVGTAADAACVTGITFADAMVAPLADNTGPVPTVSILSSSPAVGLGTNCPATDARGHARNSSHCAAGAFEP